MALPIRRATPQPKPLRSSSRWRPALPFNSGGITAVVTRATQKPRPTRPTSDVGINPAVNRGGAQWIVSLPYNSGGIRSQVTQGVRRKPAPVKPSRSLPAPPYNSGGILFFVRRGVLRKPRAVVRPQIVIPPTPGAVVIPTTPVVTTGRRWAAVRRALSRVLQALRYNSGGIAPQIASGVRRPAAKNRPSRPAPALPYNSGGLAPTVGQGVRRLPAKGRPSRPQIAPIPPAPPGTPPVVTRPLKWAAIRRGLPRFLIPGQAPVTSGPGSVQIFLSNAFPTQVAITDAFPAQAFISAAFPASVFITDINGGSVSFFVGKAMRIANWGGTTGSPTGGFRNSSGTLYDPPSPAIRYRIANQTEVTVSSGSLTHDGTGLYSVVVTPTVDGDLMATAVSGDGAYADPQTAKVEPAPL